MRGWGGRALSMQVRGWGAGLARALSIQVRGWGPGWPGPVDKSDELGAGLAGPVDKSERLGAGWPGLSIKVWG